MREIEQARNGLDKLLGKYKARIADATQGVSNAG